MPRDNLADSSRTMINQGRCDVSAAQKNKEDHIGPIDPHALKVPARRAEYIFPSARNFPHFHAEPIQIHPLKDIGPGPFGWLAVHGDDVADARQERGGLCNGRSDVRIGCELRHIKCVLDVNYDVLNVDLKDRGWRGLRLQALWLHSHPGRYVACGRECGPRYDGFPIVGHFDAPFCCAWLPICFRLLAPLDKAHPHIRFGRVPSPCAGLLAPTSFRLTCIRRTGPRVVNGSGLAVLIFETRGDRNALDRLVELVFPELRRVARQLLVHRRPGESLESAALANEAYLKLVRTGEIRCEDRVHFLALCSQMMRRIVVDHARRRRFAKRGGDAQRLSLDEVLLVAEEPGVEVLALDEALNALARIDPRKSRLVELRYFGGLTSEEAAEALGVSVDTAKRDWRMARAWLLGELTGKVDSAGS